MLPSFFLGGLPGFAGGHFGGCEDDAVATVSFIYFFWPATSTEFYGKSLLDRVLE